MGGGGGGGLQGTEKHTGRSKMGALRKTLTTLSYLKYKEGTVISDTTKELKNKTRALYQFMNTTFVLTGL